MPTVANVSVFAWQRHGLWIVLLVGLLPVRLFAANPAAPAVDYQRDIQPIFDRYCVACHACFDAPCQLKLTQASGVARGATKARVYDGGRLEAAEPTRLSIDAHGVTEWRARGFFSVLGGNGTEPVMMRLLDAAALRPLASNRPLPKGLDIGIDRTQICAAPAEIDSTLRDNPHLGMPFALPQIPTRDRETIRRWIAEGAPLKSASPTIPASEAQQIAEWETWLNDPRPRRRLLSRWLFEHWTIARLQFDELDTGHYFRLVRSRTPPGEPVDEIATRRSNDDPGGDFFYRFRLQTGTLVYKTQIRFALDGALRRQLEQLFLKKDWNVASLPGYSDRERANPFATFAAIPAEARYRFMLEHAGYFVRSFIRGPVCRGQLATDVIRDHFWVMFQTPARDPYIVDAAYRKKVDPLLALPGLATDLLSGARSWFDASEDRNRYAALRQKRLAELAPQGADIQAIWNGDGDNDNALLTVFRHHDNAAVKRGWLGQLPLTAWWMDFPLFERSYYDLVVNFDVFGNVAHQAQTRLYFDLIRNGAEQNFLRLLPAKSRQAVLDSWYAGSGKIKLWIAYQDIDTQTPSAVQFTSDSPKRELLQRLLHRFKAINRTPDPINRPDGHFDNREQALLSRLTELPAERMPAIRQMPDAALLLLADSHDSPHLYTLIRNRRHSNVAFVLGESLRYQPKKDTLSVVPGIATGYPNFFFVVPPDQLPAFVDALRRSDAGDRDVFVREIVDRWGVRRSAPSLWNVYHAIHAVQQATMPLDNGLLDLNRYIDYRP